MCLWTGEPSLSPGKERISSETINYLSIQLTDPEKKALLRESSESSDWIVDTIHAICSGGAEIIQKTL